MKKRIAAIFLIGLLFAFLCSVPASAVVSDDFSPKQTFKCTEFGTVRYMTYNSSDVNVGYDSFSNVGSFEFPVSGLSSASVWVYPVVNSAGSVLPFAEIKDGEKYVMTLKYQILYDGEPDSSFTNSFLFFNIHDYLNADITQSYDGGSYLETGTAGTYTFKSIFTLGDISDASVTDGVYSLENFAFGISNLSGVDKITVNLKSFSLEIYDSSQEDYGYSSSEDLSEFESAWDGMIQDCINFIDPIVNYSDGWQDDVDTAMTKLEGFKDNFLTPVYEAIPDFLEWLIGFAMTLLVMRKVVGR